MILLLLALAWPPFSIAAAIVLGRIIRRADQQPTQPRLWDVPDHVPAAWVHQ